MHVACPTPDADPEDEKTISEPAIQGTLNVLAACRDSKTVKRVVYTSCSYAIAGENQQDFDKTYSEANWSDSSKKMAILAKCKTLAEQTAWNFLDELPGKNRRCFELF